ncbi:agmatine deiminase family protein [Streptomyces sp. NBC_01210]|uniref:agmatine deiminase family protein n=1 Tax=Streptomyces sp. NBC_01210 TaxID=2903774 RepID=UPI002E0DF4D6|nr:agmatine deiminase family protein [Streptomyces sp. NBC_01210]
MGLTVVRDLRDARRPTTAAELERLETNILAGFILARVAAGTDRRLDEALDRGPDHIANDTVLMPRFGDRKADNQAAALISDLYPDREVVQLEIHTIAEGGGGIHCATQQQPTV